MRAFFVKAYLFFERRPRLFWFSLVLAFAWSAWGALQIHVEQDIRRMIPPDRSVLAMEKALGESQSASQVVFTIQFRDTARSDPDSLLRISDQLLAQLDTLTVDGVTLSPVLPEAGMDQQLIRSVLTYLPVFLSAEDYHHLDDLLRPGQIEATLAKQQKLLLSPAGMAAASWVAQDPVGILPLALEKFKNAQLSDNYRMYGGSIFDTTLRKLTLLLEINTENSQTGRNTAYFSALEAHMDDWNSAHAELITRYFGAPAVAAGNALQLQRDTWLTLGVTVLLLLALTFYVFRRKRAPFLLMLPVVFGGLFGLAVTAFIQGSVSVIALGAGAVILGIAIDFSVHFMSHARRHPDMIENVRSLVFPLTLGAFTTIAAFFALRFARAPLLQDLGTFASFSLLGAALFTLIFLPHLIRVKQAKAPVRRQENIIDRLAMWRPEKNKWLVLIVFLLTPVFAYFAGKVRFDGDLMRLNYLSPEMAEAQAALSADNPIALRAVYVISEGKTEDEAAARLHDAAAVFSRLQESGKVIKVVDPTTVLPDRATQAARIASWQRYWTSEKKAEVRSRVQAASAALGFSPDAFDPFSRLLNQDFQPIDTTTATFLKTFFPNAFSHTRAKSTLIATLHVAPGSRGEVFAALKPVPDVWVTDRQSVSEALLTSLKLDFNRILLISGGLVFFVLLIAYGRIELALISFLPMAVTWVWILGMMALLGIEFNVVNIIISTLIFGLGDDYSIFMMDSLLERYKTGATALPAARSAVYLSVLTTIIGLGVLGIAAHPALKSIALVSVLGLVCVVFIAQVLQPFLFNFMIQARADKGFMPFTLWSFLKSAFSFTYFFVGCLVVTLIGVLLMGFRPFGRKRSKYLFHAILSKYTGSVMYVMTNVKKDIRRLDPASFSRPAVYIANHSSFLDILITTMLHPKLILMTNRWVWRSPVFGKIVRMAEYFPAEEGVEDSLPALQRLVNDGYGIVVFPEGTRSKDDQIHRFHKGAFFLAEKLSVPMVPVVLHGVHYTMQKGDWLLKDGRTTAVIYPPRDKFIPDEGYSQQAPAAARWFRAAYRQLKRQIEQPAYFREQLTKSYLYKGPVLEWYCKVKLRLESFYAPFHTLLPEAGLIYDLGCGYGFMSYMLHWVAPDRTIRAFDYDAEKIGIAQNNYTRHLARQQNAVVFAQMDLNDVRLDRCRGIVISDVLHYLLPGQQEVLLDKCYEALDDTGVLIVRDGVKELQVRHRGTRLSEFFSTQLLGFNKTQNKLHFLSKKFLSDWARRHGLSMEVIDHSRRTSNLIFVFKKSAAQVPK